MPEVAVVFVLGLGCHASTERWCRKTKDMLATKDFTCICNRYLAATLSDLTSMCVFRKALSNTLPIVKHVVDVVRLKLEQGKVVNLMGHSYGGAVVSMAAAAIWEIDPHAALEVNTYGSVYTPFVFPGGNETTKVHHMLFFNDKVALSCNGLRPHMPSPPCVVWLVKVGRGGFDTHRSYGRSMIADAQHYDFEYRSNTHS